MNRVVTESLVHRSSDTSIEFEKGFQEIISCGARPATRRARAHGSFPEDFSSPDLVLQIDALALHDLAAGEQCTDVMAFDALHVHSAIPTRSQDLSDAASVMFVGLVAHGRKRGIDLAGLHAHDVKPRFFHSVGQMLGERASLQPYLVDRFAELAGSEPGPARRIERIARAEPSHPWSIMQIATERSDTSKAA